MIDQMYGRLEALVKHLLAAGVGPMFGYVGPELCVPPLQSPRDFRDFCTAYYYNETLVYRGAARDAGNG
jgi:hypothetical protein